MSAHARHRADRKPNVTGGPFAILLPKCHGLKLACNRFPAIEWIAMSTPEILAHLPRLSAEERELVRSRLDAIDASAPLSAEEKRLIDERVASYRQKPEGVSWTVAETDIRRQLGL
jgi:hypothetical protein